MYANGAQKWSQTSGVDYTTLQPGSQGYMHYINVGRNNPDGWSAFNGDIGDVFVYKVALTDAERQQLEADLYNKFISFFITASASYGGTISPTEARRLVTRAARRSPLHRTSAARYRASRWTG